MTDRKCDFVLEEIPLFAGLSPKQLRVISERVKIKEFKKGDIIYAEGSPPSAFYCLILGRVVIYSDDPSGKRTVLEYLHRGKYFGIISLLTNEAHSVTAQALNDCSVAVIEKNDFDYILQNIPKLAIDLSRTLSRRLKRKDIHNKTIFESTIISIFSSYSQAGKTIYALNLGLGLARETHKSVVILDIAPIDKAHSLPQKLQLDPERIFKLSGRNPDNPALIKDYVLKSKFGLDVVCFHYQPEDEDCLRRVLSIMSILVNDYHYLILDLPSLMDKPVFSILNQSDLIHILTSPEPVDLKRTYHLIYRLKEEFGFSVEKIKPIINEYKLAKIDHEQQVGFLRQPVFATLPQIDFSATDRLILDNPSCEYSKAVRRIARELGECLVGLVLGVGAAYGFCHIGVLKVIEEEKFSVDVVSGSSIGSLIAAFWVAGYSSSQILEIVSNEFKEAKHIWGLVDFTIPRLGFMKGNKLQRFLKKYLGDKTFYDTRLPLKIVASDVKRKEPRVLDRGLLADAVMASCTMPGVFAPFRLKEEMLFDGGVSSPLPTEPLFKMGINKIIAVNVTPSREDVRRQYDTIRQKLSDIPNDIKKRKWFSLKDHMKSLFNTNIVDIIFSSVEVLQSEVAQKESLLADLVLHPDTAGLFWLELHRAKEFAKRGEDEARRNLDKIKQLINE